MESRLLIFSIREQFFLHRMQREKPPGATPPRSARRDWNRLTAPNHQRLLTVTKSQEDQRNRCRQQEADYQLKTSAKPQDGLHQAENAWNNMSNIIKKTREQLSRG